MWKSRQSGQNIKKMGLLFLGIFSGLIASPFTTRAQVAMTAVPFLEINNDARSMGMAGANVAMRGARSGIHLNPAAFGKPGMLEFTSQVNFKDTGYFFGTPWLPGFHVSDLKIVTPQFIAGFEKFSIGYQYTYLDLGEQSQTTPGSREPIGTFRSHERAHTFSAAYHFSKHFSLGMGVNFIKSDLATGQQIGGYEIKAPTRTTWDIGLLADYPVQQENITITPSFGWSLTDFGQPIRYTANTQSDPMPIVMRAGVGLEISTNEGKYGLKAISVAGYLSGDKIMARSERRISSTGDTTYVAMKPLEAIFNSWDPLTLYRGNETITLSLKDQLRRQLGVEMTFFEFLSIRVGSYWEHKHNGDRKYTTLGFGVNYKYFSLDYAEIDPDEYDHPFEGTEYMQLTASLPLHVIERWFD